MGIWQTITTWIRESLFAGPGAYDPDADLTAAGGGSAYFRRLTQGKRDLQPIVQERAQELAYWLYDTNPLAKRILELTRDFVLGENLAIQATDADPKTQEAVQSVLNAFWTDPLNRLDITLPAKVLELGLYGEQCYPVFLNPVNGHVRLGYIDPADIKSVLHDPENAERAIAIVLKGLNEERRYKVIAVEEAPGSDTYGRLAAPVNAEGQPTETYQEDGITHPYAGYCFWFTVNKVSNARRGRSDLLSLADWLDGFDQFLFNEVDRSLLLKSFIWDVTWTGLSPEQVAEKAKTTPPPKPDTVRHHNENVTWQAVTPDLKTVDATNAADLLLSYIATGAGLPKTWLNGMMDVNRASAQEMSEPAIKRLTARQQTVRFMLEHICTFVLDQAELAGQLPRRKDAAEAWSYHVVLPDLRIRDTSIAATALNQVMQALATARADDVIDVQVAQEVFAALATQLGVEIDLAEMRKRLETAQAVAAAQDRLAPYRASRNGLEPAPDEVPA